MAGEDAPDRALGGCVSFLSELKADPGQLGLETMLKEIAKLERVRAVGLPPDLFADTSERQLASWRAPAANMYPSDFRSAPGAIRLTLLAALCAVRAAEITDCLVDLLIDLVLKIDTKAERRMERELVDDLKRVRGEGGAPLPPGRGRARAAGRDRAAGLRAPAGTAGTTRRRGFPSTASCLRSG